MLLSETVALVEGVTAFVLLIGMQYTITWFSVRSGTVRNLVKSEPSLLFYDGSFLEQVMTREPVTQDEVQAAVRQQGKGSMAEVNAVILETDGTFSVLSSPMEVVMRSTLKNTRAVGKDS